MLRDRRTRRGGIGGTCQTINADLIVLTTHGRGGVARMWLGNVADALLRHGCVPVLVVRPRDPPPRLEHALPITRILVPLDGSPLAEQVLEPACALGDRFGAGYLLLHVFGAFPAGGYATTLTQIEQRARTDIQTYLNNVADRLRVDGRVVDTAVCSEEQPALAILETTRQHGADLIALADAWTQRGAPVAVGQRGRYRACSRYTGAAVSSSEAHDGTIACRWVSLGTTGTYAGKRAPLGTTTCLRLRRRIQNKPQTQPKIVYRTQPCAQKRLQRIHFDDSHER